MLVLVEDHFKFKLLGSTRDDAAGESFDKIARFLGLGYPGGPVIEKVAFDGDSEAFHFPRGMLHERYEFSFSGLKTAVIQEIQRLKKENIEFKTEDICASFQMAVVDVLVKKSIKACQAYGVNHLVLSGGVTANKALRTTIESSCEKVGIQCYIPRFEFCTDNAAMIGAAAYYWYQHHPETIPFYVSPNQPICN